MYLRICALRQKRDVKFPRTIIDYYRRFVSRSRHRMNRDDCSVALLYYRTLPLYSIRDDDRVRFRVHPNPDVATADPIGVKSIVKKIRRSRATGSAVRIEQGRFRCSRDGRDIAHTVRYRFSVCVCVARARTSERTIRSHDLPETLGNAERPSTIHEIPLIFFFFSFTPRHFSGDTYRRRVVPTIVPRHYPRGRVPQDYGNGIVIIIFVSRYCSASLFMNSYYDRRRRDQYFMSV